jgi:hypothetical protein
MPIATGQDEQATMPLERVRRRPAKFLMKKLPLERWIWRMHSAGERPVNDD